MNVTCTCRGLLGLQDRLKLQAVLHGTNFAQALHLVQGWQIPAMTAESAPPIIVGGYDRQCKTLFLELVGKSAYAYEHKPPVKGHEDWEGEVLLAFLKEIIYNYGALSKLKEASTNAACCSRVRGDIRTYWLVRQYAFFTLPLRHRSIPKEEELKRMRKKKLPPPPPFLPTPFQLELF